MRRTEVILETQRTSPAKSAALTFGLPVSELCSAEGMMRPKPLQQIVSLCSPPNASWGTLRRQEQPVPNFTNRLMESLLIPSQATRKEA